MVANGTAEAVVGNATVVAAPKAKAAKGAAVEKAAAGEKGPKAGAAGMTVVTVEDLRASKKAAKIL